MSTSHNGNDYERLKEELRRLKRRGAPWYFESALHQRLHGGRPRRPRRRPISILPVLAVAFVTLCILGLAVYAVLIHTNLAIPVPRREASADSVSRVQLADTLLRAVRPGPAPANVTPRAPQRTSPPDTSRRDTTAPRPPGMRPHRADSAGVAPESTPGGIDTSSHGIDTTGGPGNAKEG